MARGTIKDVNRVGVGTAAMGVTASIAEVGLVMRETTRALTVQTQVLVPEPAPMTAMLDAQTARATGVTKARGVKARQTRGGTIHGALPSPASDGRACRIL